MLDEAGTMRARPLRVPTPYPLPPALFVKTLVDLGGRLPSCGPGHRRHAGHAAPRRGGRDPALRDPHRPADQVDPELVAEWSGFDARTALADAFGLPVLVLNDAEVHGAGVVAGTGSELVLTLGTGLGCALFDGGVLAPHLELSQAPVRWGMSYDTYIGEHERRRLGDAFWSRRVRGGRRRACGRSSCGTGSTSAAATRG